MLRAMRLQGLVPLTVVRPAVGAKAASVDVDGNVIPAVGARGAVLLYELLFYKVPPLPVPTAFVVI